MKKTLYLFIVLIGLPGILSAQFPDRFHTLKPKQAPASDLKNLIDQKVNVLLLKQIASEIKYLQTIPPLQLDSNNLPISNITEHLQQFEQDIKSDMTDAITDIIAKTQTLSKSDSLKFEYYKLVGHKLSDNIDPVMAGIYRHRIDTIIKRYHAYADKYQQSASLKADTIIADFLTAPSSDAPEEKTKQELKLITQQLNYINETLPLLYMAREYFDFLNRSERNPVLSSWKIWRLPLKSITHAEYLYFGEDGERIRLLSSFGIQSNFSDNVTATSDILSGILPFEMRFKKGNPSSRLGLPVKFDLGITISKNVADTLKKENKDINSLIYGGLLHARLSYPLFYSNWKYHNGKGIRLLLPVSTTFHWNSKAEVNEQLSKLYFFNELAANLAMEIDIIQNATAQSDAAIFLNAKIAHFTGSNTFYKQHSFDNKSLSLFQINGGLRVKNRFSIAANIPVWSSQNQILAANTASIAILIDPNF